MKSMQFVIAAVVVVIGTLGVTLGIFAIAKTQATADQLARNVPSALGRAAAVVTLSRDRSTVAVAFLQTTRKHLSEVRQAVHRFNTDDGSRLTALLDSLDDDLVQQFDRAEEFVRSLQTGLQSASSMMLLFESLPFFNQHGSRSGTTGENQLKAFADDVKAFNATLEHIAEALSEIRSKRTADPEQIALLQGALRRADKEIHVVQLGLDKLSRELGTLHEGLTRVQKSSPTRIHRVALFVALFFGCFTVAQVNLAYRGAHTLGALRRLGTVIDQSSDVG